VTEIRRCIDCGLVVHRNASRCWTCFAVWRSGNVVNPMARFLEKISLADNGCWIWAGGVNNRGYPCFSLWALGRRHVYAHRYAYELFIGPIPGHLQLDHLCRTPACVNPTHLEAVTSRENTHRGMAPSAIAWRGNQCHRGHNLAVHGYERKDRFGRICRACQRQRRRRPLQRAAA
jgi:hypothetical protein